MQLDHKRFHEHRVGFWLPKDPKIIKNWVDNLMKRAVKDRPLDPTLVQFKKTVEGDPVLKPLAASMFVELPDLPQYKRDPIDLKPQITNFDDMLVAFNEILQSAPVWSDAANKVGLIGFPINAVIDWPMGTAAGYVFFLYYPQVNECLKAILTKWATYLQSPASTTVLAPPNGWLGTDGLDALTVKGNQDGPFPAKLNSFTEIYNCPDPSNLDTFGFESWDKFFIREFNDGTRPVAGIGDDTVIVHACESAPLQYPVSNAKITDDFMGKNQAYSLSNMLHNDPLAEQFVGGTVYQAFLSALSYHRWHSPIDGTIKKAYVVPGTYYSENIFQGFLNGEPLNPNPDPAAPNLSQPFIASVATRALIFIESPNPNIGLMCFIAIGMAEVSSCEIYVKPDQQVRKGDQIGTFHFGGSTHCLVFGPDTKLNWTDLPPKGDPKYEDLPNCNINSQLATVGS
ncbi:hypothetical protein MMC10_000965 [Thelotrema lepadinum]|nr:hypothetical protein [Thelotrema lepadinum]